MSTTPLNIDELTKNIGSGVIRCNNGSGGD